MKINWYPGHMTKAMRMMEDAAKTVDCFIYVLDARAIEGSQNPAFDKIIKTKPVLYVVTKTDTVETRDAEEWKRIFSERGLHCVFTDATASKGKKEILSALLKLNAEKLERYSQKGVKTSVRAMVIGVPNCGKSTLINSLCGGKKTVTGDKAGVTRGKQWVIIGNSAELLDTPGTLPPDMKNQTAALHLAYIGSVKDEILDSEELALSLIGFLRTNERDKFEARYGEFEGTDLEAMEKIAADRGYVFKKGAADYERTAKAVLDDFRKRRIGKIMLEKPRK